MRPEINGIHDEIWIGGKTIAKALTARITEHLSVELKKLCVDSRTGPYWFGLPIE